MSTQGVGQASVGDLYLQWTLNGLIEIAYAIALDVAARPQVYTGDMPEAVADLRLSYGTGASFPNLAQRRAMMLPILGPSDALKPVAKAEPSKFHQAQQTFLDACVAFSERAVDSGLAMLEQRVRSSIIPLRAHFTGLQGKAFDLVAKLIDREFNTASAILRSHGVAGAFGVPPAGERWPLNDTDPNGAKLVESAGHLLPPDSEYRLSYTRFILLQQAAQAGAQALDLVLSVDVASNDLSTLVTRGYEWASSLREFQPAA